MWYYRMFSLILFLFLNFFSGHAVSPLLPRLFSSCRVGVGRGPRRLAEQVRRLLTVMALVAEPVTLARRLQ